MNLTHYHIVTRFLQQWELHKDREALRKRTPQGWQSISWNEMGKLVSHLSRLLIDETVEVQDKVAIFSNNVPEWTISDLAIMQIRAVTVPIHATEPEQQLTHILNDSDSKLIFVGQQEQYSKVLAIYQKCPNLQKIIVLDKNIPLEKDSPSLYWEDFMAQQASEDSATILQKRLDSRNMEDLFTLIYTSGTTGLPKGVMLDYKNLAFQLYSHESSLKVTSEDVSLCFLPLSHIFERAWTAYMLHCGAVNCYLDDTQKVQEALLEVKPSLMCAVPRFYEKIYAKIYDKAARSSIGKKIIFSWAVRLGKRKIKRELKGKSMRWLDRKLFPVADRLVFSKFRDLLGGNIRCMPCGGAKLEPSIGLFFHAMGINVKLGYGLTETTATISLWEDHRFNPSSVGKILPGIEVKIGENNEILVKGDGVMKGYHKMPEQTREAFTEDGFFRTGDAGQVDKQGNILITDRIKELMKTSNGKYISPQNIERKVGKDNLIDQIMVIADGRKFVSALIVPNYEALNSFIKEMKIQYKQQKDLIKIKEIQELFYKRIQKFQKSLPEYEKIKKFTLLSNPFSIKNNEITSTLKLKRKEIYQRYRKEIESMYSK